MEDLIKIQHTLKILIEHHSKSASNSLNSLEAFLIMRHHLRVVFLLMRHRLINHVGMLVWIGIAFLATMYTKACGLHLLERSLLPSGIGIMQVIATQNIYVNVHAAHCAALALRGIPCVKFLILRHFLILHQN